MGFLIKSSDELFEKGQDLVKQREFEKALPIFIKSAEKAKNIGQNDLFILSNALASVLALFGQVNNPQALHKVAQDLAPLGENEIKVGINTVKSSDLMTECQISAQDFHLHSAEQSSSLWERAIKLENIGVAYQTRIGDKELFVPAFYGNRTETGMQRALKLFAESNESKAEFVVAEDPKKAAEFYLNAINFRKQINDVRSEQNNLIKVSQYSKSASCWFCAREIEGENVHFFKLNASITPLLRRVKTDSALPSMDPEKNVVFACVGCYSAVSNVADAIALQYHNLAMAKLAEINNHLQAQINSLQSQVNSLIRYSHSH